MIPADCNNIVSEYSVLLNELKLYNPELLDKRRLLAVTKADLIDEELKDAMRPELPDDIPVIFISSVTGAGIPALKDLLWRAINS